ncbi:MAG: HEAT repeat domain-containing protein [Planctomycetes bacterium]|nr:HEAT repeat domain-containing protein [Planctomycetota bacterium]
MDENGLDRTGDGLDAFFSAASHDDSQRLRQAAEWVGESTSRNQGAAPDDGVGHSVRPARTRRSTRDRQGRLVDLDPTGNFGSDGPRPARLTLPANLTGILPWWAWVAVGISVTMLFAAILVLPGVRLRQLTARLADPDPATVQFAMRTLINQGNERTVSSLENLAMSRKASVTVRLRAVDTLGLIGAPGADGALRRLELGSTVDRRVRDAAGAALRGRQAAGVER